MIDWKMLHRQAAMRRKHAQFFDTDKVFHRPNDGPLLNKYPFCLKETG
jgi:hypothetical protein